MATAKSSRPGPTAPITRTNWRNVAHDARRMAQALEALGIKPGDRVATLAMNHSHHLTAWYGAIGMGGVLHTINPRLFDEQLEYIANHAEDRVLLYDHAFAPIVERMKPQVDDDRALYLLRSAGGLERRRLRRLDRAA